MANDVKFEGKERRLAKIEKCLAEYGLSSLEEARDLCLSKGIDVDGIVKGVQPIAFDNASWAYTLGVAVALKKGVATASEAAAAIGIGLQAFCIPGSVAEQRNVGLGHGNLGARLLHEDTKCFAFLAGHESFAAAEGAIGIARTANKVRKEPLKVILNGLGKDAAYIISRVNGFTYVKTDYDFYTGELKIEEEKLQETYAAAPVNADGVKVLALPMEGHDAKDIKAFLPKVTALENTLSLLVAVQPERISYAVALGVDTEGDCRSVIKLLNEAFGGRGGGKSDCAQGGADYCADWQEKLQSVVEKLK